MKVGQRQKRKKTIKVWLTVNPRDWKPQTEMWNIQKEDIQRQEVSKRQWRRQRRKGNISQSARDRKGMHGEDIRQSVRDRKQ